MRMLRRCTGKTGRDRIRDNIIREIIGAIEVLMKIRERRLSRFGRVVRSEEGHVLKRVCNAGGGEEKSRARRR